MKPRTMLRVEGMAVFLGATAAYFWLDGSLWLYLALALAPDCSMIGYLVGKRIGTICYNAVHTYTTSGILLGLGVWFDVRLAVLIGLIWTGHIGADRLASYGLKYTSGYKRTHLTTDELVPQTELSSAESVSK